MMNRKYSPLLTGLMALLFVIVAVVIGWRVVRGDSSLLRHVVVQKEIITPNADGSEDATYIEYEISRNATVSIFFENEAGKRFYFRREKPRGAGEYRVDFSGIVDGYQLSGETIAGEVLTRLLQNGAYTWTVEAVDMQGNREAIQGSLQIVDADPVLPAIRDFSIYPLVFTPNRDGISDRAEISLFLDKDVDQLRVFILGSDGTEYPIEEDEKLALDRAEGWHYFDYDAGVDDAATPPPDGTYTVVAMVRDLEGQQMRAENELTIQYGGVPRARIVPSVAGDTFALSATAVVLCDTLYFTVTVENYGSTPIRTSGPPPGTVYDSDWIYNTMNWHTESGVMRIGVGFENELRPYPYRWAVGNATDLEEIDGHAYLMPGKRAIVTGGIRVVDVFGDRNPQPIWVGLIHEDVEISELNNHVDPHAVLVDIPDPAHMLECPAREVPMKPTEN